MNFEQGRRSWQVEGDASSQYLRERRDKYTAILPFFPYSAFLCNSEDMITSLNCLTDIILGLKFLIF